MTALTDPEGNPTTYTYNRAGWTEEVVDPFGVTMSYDYDLAGQVT